jgi:hypothetical protein
MRRMATDPYLIFWLDGREDVADGGLKVEVDISALAKKAIDGGDVRKLVIDAADAAVKPFALTRKKAKWLVANEDGIDAAGGDKDKAYKEYARGQAAELATILEDEVVEEMRAQLDGGDLAGVDDDEEEEQWDEDREEDEDEIEDAPGEGDAK